MGHIKLILIRNYAQISLTQRVMALNKFKTSFMTFLDNKPAYSDIKGLMKTILGSIPTHLSCHSHFRFEKIFIFKMAKF